jgi:NitT/TauT family transport system substrate-binding protein
VASAKSGWITIISGIVIVLVLIIIHSALLTQPDLEKRKPLTIGIQNNPIDSLIIIAQGEGFFNKQGLSVKLVPYASGKLALQAMLQYRVNMAASSDIPILVAAFHKDPIKILAVLNVSPSMAQVVVRRGRGIRVPRDLMGKRIATQSDSGVDYYTYLFLKHYGMSISDVDLIYMPASKLVMALRSGYVDAFVMRSPYTEEAERYLPGQVLFLNVPDLYKVRFSLVTTKAFVQSHPVKVTRVLKALILALKFSQQHHFKAQQDVIRFFGLGRRDEVLSLWSHYLFSVDLANQLIPSLQKQADWVVKTGKGSSSNIPNFKELIDPIPLEAARKALGVPVPSTPYYDTPPEPISNILKAKDVTTTTKANSSSPSKKKVSDSDKNSLADDVS